MYSCAEIASVQNCTLPISNAGANKLPSSAVTYFDSLGFLGTSTSAMYPLDRTRILFMSATYSPVFGFVTSSSFHNDWMRCNVS